MPRTTNVDVAHTARCVADVMSSHRLASSRIGLASRRHEASAFLTTVDQYARCRDLAVARAAACAKEERPDTSKTCAERAGSRAGVGTLSARRIPWTSNAVDRQRNWNDYALAERKAIRTVRSAARQARRVPRLSSRGAVRLAQLGRAPRDPHRCTRRGKLSSEDMEKQEGA